MSDRLYNLNALIAKRGEEFLAELGIILPTSRHSSLIEIHGPCPIHNGTNPNGFHVWIRPDNDDETRAPFVWRCFTKGCHQEYPATATGLALAMLSKENKVSFKVALDFCLRFCGFSSLEEVPGETQEEAWTKLTKRFEHTPKTIEESQESFADERLKLRNYLNIPSGYWRRRGFSGDFLSERDIGDMFVESHRWFNRAVVPVREPVCLSENKGTKTVGFTARTLYPKCKICGRYHPKSEFSTCPPQEECEPKWIHSRFSTDEHFYGLERAVFPIRAFSRAILVESPGDVLRLQSAGYEDAIALFGIGFSDRKQILLEQLGVMNVVILLNSDDAGNKGKENLRKKLKKIFCLSTPSLPEGVNDCCDMTEEQIIDCLESQGIMRP